MKSIFHSADGTQNSRPSSSGSKSFIGVQAKLKDEKSDTHSEQATSAVPFISPMNASNYIQSNSVIQRKATKKQTPNQILDKKVETVYGLSQYLVKAQVEIPKKNGSLEIQLLLLKDDLFDKVKGKDKKIKDINNKILSNKKKLKVAQSEFETHFDDLHTFVEENVHNQFPGRGKQTFDPNTFGSKSLKIKLATIYRVRIGLVVDKLQMADTEFMVYDDQKPHIINLLLGTAIKESELRSQIQKQGGPGRGSYQSEGNHKSGGNLFIVDRFLKLKNHAEMKEFFFSHRKDADQSKRLHKNELVDNFELATIHAIFAYLNNMVDYDKKNINDLSFPETSSEQAQLWKKKWNTASGAGTADQYTDLWNQHKK